jgi:shikimate dehydrogenase
MDPADPLPVIVENLTASQFVACAVTKPAVPPLIAAARQRGCATMTGAGMFQAQAEILIDFLLAQGSANA